MKFSTIKEKIKKILVWSQKYTKTDMLYLAKGGTWLSIAHFIAMGSSFLLSILFANLLDKEAYGNFKYILSVISILSVTTLSGMDSAIIRAITHEKEGTLLRALKEKIKFGLIGSLGSSVIAIYYLYNGNLTLFWCFLLSSFIIPIMDPFFLYDAYLQGKKDYQKSTLYYTISQISYTATIAILLFLGKSTIYILAAYLLIWTFTRFLFLKKIKNKIKNNKIDDESISFGKHLSFINVLNTFTNYLDKLIIFNFIGATELAVYSIATAPIDQIKTIFKNLQTLAIPKFSEKSLSEIKQSIKHKIRLLFFITLAITILYFLSAPLIFKFIFPKYPEAVLYSRIFALSIITLSTSPLYAILTAHKKKKEINTYFIFFNITQILLEVLLTWSNGLIGLILARLIARLVSFTVLILMASKKSFWLDTTK